MPIFNNKNYLIDITFLIVTPIVIYLSFEDILTIKMIISFFLIFEFTKFFLVNNNFLIKHIIPPLKKKNEDISSLVINIFLLIFLIFEILFLILYNSNYSEILILLPFVILNGIISFFFNFYFNKFYLWYQIVLNIIFNLIILFKIFSDNVLFYLYLIITMSLIQLIMNTYYLKNKINFFLNINLFKDYRTFHFLKKLIRHSIKKDLIKFFALILIVLNLLFISEKI